MNNPDIWPTTADEVPGAIDDLNGQVRKLLGDGLAHGFGDTWRALKVAYQAACDELKKIEADEPTEREEYEKAHAPGRLADARALKRQI